MFARASFVLLSISGSASESVSVDAQALLDTASKDTLEQTSDEMLISDDGSSSFSMNRFQELFDRDKDGQITFSEMKTAFAKGYGDDNTDVAAKTVLLEENGADFLSDVKELFDNADTDKDGSLTADEVAQSLDMQQNLIVDLPEDVHLALIQEGENNEGDEVDEEEEEDDDEDDEEDDEEHSKMLLEIADEVVEEEGHDIKISLDELRDFLRHEWDGVSSGAKTDEQKFILDLKQGEVENIRKSLETADLDQDGFLSMPEIRGAKGLAEFLNVGEATELVQDESAAAELSEFREQAEKAARDDENHDQGDDEDQDDDDEQDEGEHDDDEPEDEDEDEE